MCCQMVTHEREDCRAIIRCLFALSWLSALVTNADETCNGTFEFKSPTVHGKKLIAEANTHINITFFLNYKCNDSENRVIEISSLDKSSNEYITQCSVVLKNGTCYGLLNAACGCLDTPGAYSFRKTVTESDTTDWKWSTKDSNVSTVIAFHVTESLNNNAQIEPPRSDNSKEPVDVVNVTKQPIIQSEPVTMSQANITTFLDNNNILMAPSTFPVTVGQKESTMSVPDLGPECQDKRKDCFLFANTCSTAGHFAREGCRRTCALCNPKITVPDLGPECQDTRKDCFMFANTCSTAGHFAREGCRRTCALCNPKITESPEKPYFYLNSKENGTNITVNEHQTVNFVCRSGSTTKDSLFLFKVQEIENSSLASIHNSSDNLTLNNSYNYTNLLMTCNESGGNWCQHTIQSVQCSHSGEYQCQAVRYQMTNYSSATLRVECDKHIRTFDEEYITDHSESSTDLSTSKDAVTQPNSSDDNSTRITLPVIGAVAVVAVVVLFVLLNKYPDCKLLSKLHVILSPNDAREQTNGMTSDLCSRGDNHSFQLHKTEKNDAADIDRQCIYTSQELLFNNRSRDESMTKECPIYSTLDFTTTRPKTFSLSILKETNDYAIIDFGNIVYSSTTSATKMTN